MKFHTISKMLGLMLLTFFCAACGPNNLVPLTYPAKDAALLPAPNAPRVAVVMFTDKRSTQSLGTRSKGSFESTVAVPDWISRSFADALSRRGAQASIASSVQQARAAGITYIVTGVVSEASLTEASLAELRATITASVTLHGPQGTLLNETLSASQSETGIISTGTATHLLQSTVQQLIRPGADKIAQFMGLKR